MRSTEWIGLIWGADYPMVSVIATNGEVIAKHAAPVDLSPSSLAEFLSAQAPTPVLCAGLPGMPTDMYRAVPATPMAGTFQMDTPDPRVVLHVVPGLRQAKPADLMLGCETAMAGLLAQEPDFDGVICTVATQSHWSHISAGEVVSFQSYLTPVLASTLASTSPLTGCAAQGPLDETAFAQAVDDVMARPQSFAATLAHISADAALHGARENVGWSRLMGTLIGLELSGARPYWLGQNVVILGDGDLPALYKAALASQAVQARLMPRDDLSLAGLRQAWTQINKQ
ncbi:2-dehydro-3-deoxygalactonokinase [Sulfitobacter marinus]|uniref:2-dehydro-3-deoxygalactonokinase n=1 Tax=Sulfitobacter marinus TaxID=394264 RepID=A0A1I6PZW5_9RHOB|nr:2-dehydro-3-deoxygalactonokinase [Sulfitobacter marinus]SFS45702.1 2-dehydro-3-deoxygalactonokinase [Sulfitobacter marinus]